MLSLSPWLTLTDKITTHLTHALYKELIMHGSCFMKSVGFQTNVCICTLIRDAHQYTYRTNV